VVVSDISVLALWLFADIGDAVGIRVGELTGDDLAVINNIVVVAVGRPFANGSKASGVEGRWIVVSRLALQH